MKVKRSILITLLCTTIFFGCKKWVIDYRNKWTGDYSYTCIIEKWDGNTWVVKTQNSEGKVYYKPFHNFGKTITIQIDNIATFTAAVNKAGNLKKASGTKIEGNIKTNTLSFTAITVGKPGTSYTVTATRQ